MLVKHLQHRLSAEEIFAINPKIRWAGLASRRGRVIFIQMRDGLQSHTPDSHDKLTVEVRAQYIIETVEQEAVWGGEVQHVAIVFEKFVELIIPLKSAYAVITVEKDLQPDSYPAICRGIRELE